MKSIMRQTKIVMIAIAIVMGVSTTRKTWGRRMKVVVEEQEWQGGVYQQMIRKDSYVIIIASQLIAMGQADDM